MEMTVTDTTEEVRESSGPLKRVLSFIHAHFEQTFAITLAVLAAFLAINDLVADKYGSEEIILTNEKTSSYLWYQSKGIKESITEGQRDMLQVLISSGSFNEEKAKDMKVLLQKLNENIVRYKKEKKEILLGSKRVGEENWVQEINNERGKVMGAQEYEMKIEQLGQLGGRFDLASLFLQLGLVVGTVGIVLGRPKFKFSFYFLTLACGLLGFLFFGQSLYLIHHFAQAS